MEEKNYYRIKTTWLGEHSEGGDLVKRKTEELVLATSYTEAEKVAYALLKKENRTQFSDDINIEIIKTKIKDVIYNDNLQKDEEPICGLVTCYFEEGDETGVGLYGVKVMFLNIDAKSGKEKRSHETIYLPACSNADATKRVAEHLKSSPVDHVIRDAKFDPAVAILWPIDVYKNKSEAV